MSEAATSTAVGPWEYVWGGVPRPFVHPVRTPAGHVISVDEPADHPWHHGLWFTIKFVDGVNFWEEYDEFGLLEQSTPPVVQPDTDGSVLATSRIRWRRPDGAVAVEETCVMTHRERGSDAHALEWDVSLAVERDTVFDRTPFTTWGGYGGLTLRGRPDWHDTALLVGATEADEPVARVLGDRGRWLSLQGPLGPGSTTDPVVGALILDHPANPGHPMPWYASTRADTYGDDGWSNFANAAFLWDGPIEVPAGGEMRLRHRVVVHDGAWDSERIESEWNEWVG